MAHGPMTGGDPGRYVAAGVTYLVLSGILYSLWLVEDGLVVLMLLSMPTLVGGLVLLSIGRHRLRDARCRARGRGATPARPGTWRDRARSAPPRSH